MISKVANPWSSSLTVSGTVRSSESAPRTSSWTLPAHGRPSISGARLAQPSRADTWNRAISPGRAVLGPSTTTRAGPRGATSTEGEAGTMARIPSPSPSTENQSRASRPA